MPEKEARSPTGKKPHMLSKPKPAHNDGPHKAKFKQDEKSN